MRQIEGMDERLADIGIDMAGQRPEPGFHRIDAFANSGEARAMDHALDRTQLFLHDMTILVHDGDRRRQITERDVIATKRL